MPPAPAIGAVAHRGIDERSLVQTSASDRARAATDAPAWPCRCRQHVGHAPAGSLNVNWTCLHLAGDEPMLGAAEAVVKLLVLGAQLLRLDDVKAEQPVAELQPVLQRRDDLLIDAGADDERIDHGFDRMILVLVEFDVLAQVARLAVDPRPPIAVDADLLEQVLVILAVNLVDRRPHLDFRAFRQRQQMLHHLMRACESRGPRRTAGSAASPSWRTASADSRRCRSSCRRSSADWSRRFSDRWTRPATGR